MGKDYTSKKDFKNPDAPATRKQTWTLFCLTKKDYREEKLTIFEASQLINQIKVGKGSEVARAQDEVKSKKLKAALILEEAELAGVKAGSEAKPEGMIVAQHANMLDDASPVTKAWVVPEGPCGFAWVIVRCTNKESRAFINQLKKLGMATSNVNERNENIKFTPHYRGGFSYWVRFGNQSVDRKAAYAGAFAQVLSEYGINAYSDSRLD